MSGPWIALIVIEAIALAVMAVVLVALMRQVGVLLLRVGPRPAFSDGPVASHLRGERVAGLPKNLLEMSARPGTDRALVFASQTCSACLLALDAMVPLAASYSDVTFLALVDGRRDEVRKFAEERKLPLDLVAPESGLRLRLGVTEVPFALYLNRAGVVISSGVANNREHLEELVQEGRARGVLAVGPRHDHEDVS